jgi:4'-phosphopantetheinyl transferase
LARAFRFCFAAERTSYIASRGILRQLLGAYLKIAPSKVAFTHNPFGKPELAGQLAKSALRFNISHSHDVVLFAFVRARQVGVDVEKIRPDTVLGELAEDFLAPAESARLRSLPATERVTAFFECWTRKEAYLKACGEGLLGGLESFEVSFGHGAVPAILRPKESAGPPQDWSVMNLSIGPDYAGALVVEGASPGLSCFQWTPALMETRRCLET